MLYSIANFTSCTCVQVQLFTYKLWHFTTSWSCVAKQILWCLIFPLWTFFYILVIFLSLLELLCCMFPSHIYSAFLFAKSIRSPVQYGRMVRWNDLLLHFLWGLFMSVFDAASESRPRHHHISHMGFSANQHDKQNKHCSKIESKNPSVNMVAKHFVLWISPFFKLTN